MKRTSILTLAALSLLFSGCAPEIRSYYIPVAAPNPPPPDEVYIDENDNLLLAIENKWRVIKLEKFFGYHGEPTTPLFNSEYTAKDRTINYSSFTSGGPEPRDRAGFQEVQWINDKVVAADFNELRFFHKDKTVNVETTTLFPARDDAPKTIGYVLMKRSGEYAFFYIKQQKMTYFHQGGLLGWSD